MGGGNAIPSSKAIFARRNIMGRGIQPPLGILGPGGDTFDRTPSVNSRRVMDRGVVRLSATERPKVTPSPASD